jgi:hypothetical protein
MMNLTNVPPLVEAFVGGLFNIPGFNDQTQ